MDENQLQTTSVSSIHNYEMEVQFLVQQLLIGHCCSKAKHQQLLHTRKADLDTMQEKAETEEYTTDYCLVSLRKFSQNTIKSVAASSNILSFNFNESNTLVGSTIKEYSPYLLPINSPNFTRLTKEACEIIFEGINRSSTPIPTTSHLVLNTFTPQSVSKSLLRDMAFDIDSFIAIPQSLGVAKRGLQVNSHFYYFLFFYAYLYI